jgi:hypothetical protein
MDAQCKENPALLRCDTREDTWQGAPSSRFISMMLAVLTASFCGSAT